MAPKKDDDSAEHVSGQSNMPLSKVAHALEREVVVSEMKTDSNDGLTEAESKHRLEEFGRNELDNGPGVQPMKILITQGTVVPFHIPSSVML
jgi:P-type Na+/K+ transporter